LRNTRQTLIQKSTGAFSRSQKLTLRRAATCGWPATHSSTALELQQMAVSFAESPRAMFDVGYFPPNTPPGE
jgi:hypothetical protein